MENVSRERIVILIDGANLYTALKTIDFDIDYRKILTFFSSNGTLVRAIYYTAIIEEQVHSTIRPLIDWLAYNGFMVRTKPAKEYTDDAGQRKIKGNMDIEIAVDALELSDTIDHFILFSGDGDFCTMIEALQRRGKRVTVISTILSQPPVAADELRRQADVFIELASMEADIGHSSGSLHN